MSVRVTPRLALALALALTLAPIAGCGRSEPEPSEPSELTTPEVTEALADFLGNPTVCPRGNPIPDENGAFTPLDGITLREAEVGSTVRVLAVNATATDVLKYLQDKGILPGQTVKVLEAAPLDGPLTLSVNGKEVALGLSMAEFVIVE